MFPGVIPNAALATRAYPSAAQKGQMEPKLQEKIGNEQLADRDKADLSTVATAQAPVQGQDESAEAKLDLKRQPSQNSQASQERHSSPASPRHDGELSIYV